MDPNTETTNTEQTPPADAAAGGDQTTTATAVQETTTAADASPAAKSEDEQLAELIDQVQATPDGSLPAEGETASAATNEGETQTGKEGETVTEEGQPATTPPAKTEGEAASTPEAIEAEAAAEADKLGIKNEAANAKFKEMYKQVREIPALEERARRGEELFTTIQSTGATGEQLGTALSYIDAVNKGDVASMRKAHAWLTQELTWLSQQIGQTPPGADPLEGHADLQKLVEEGTPRELAVELANRRNAERADQQHQQRQSQRSVEQARMEEATAAAIEQGRLALNDLGPRLVSAESSDAGRAAAQARIEKVIATELPRIRQLPPALWAPEFELAYLRIKANEAPAAAPPPSTPRPGPQPLRPTGGSGASVVKTPTTDLEAVEAGLALYANGGGVDY